GAWPGVLGLVGLEASEGAARLGVALRGGPATHGTPLEADGEVWVRLTVRAPTAAAARARFAELEPALRAELGGAWYGTDDDRLEAVVGGLLRERGLTVALAESCTGGRGRPPVAGRGRG